MWLAIPDLERHQRAALNRWLTHGKVGYSSAVQRFYREFGIRLSRSSLSRYCRSALLPEMLPSMARKTRSDSKLKTLSDEQLSLLCGWIAEGNLRYQDAAERVSEWFGITVSRTLVFKLFQKRCGPIVKPRGDSTLARLSTAQKLELERLMFDENLPYQDLVEIVLQRFGVITSDSALNRFYKSAAKKRSVSEHKPNPASRISLATLTKAQRDIVEFWLCEANIGYVDVVSRVQNEFRVKVSKGALVRFYQERMFTRAAIGK
jgi:hypothetical protein